MSSASEAGASAEGGVLTPLVIAGSSVVFLLAVAGLGNMILTQGRIPAILQRGAVIAHLSTVLLALPLGISQLVLPKGTLRHRTLGYIWCALMVATAVVSFSFNTLAPKLPFSPIHIFSVITLVTVPGIIFAARTHRVEQHRRSVLLLMLGSLVIAGLFTFLPSRALGQLVFRLVGGH